MILDLALIGVVFFAALAWGSNEGWGMGLVVIGALGVLGVRLIWRAWNGGVRVGLSWIYVPLLVLLAYVALQPSAEKYSTIQYGLLGVAIVSVMFLTQNGFNSRDQVKFLLLSVLVLGAFEAAYGLVQYVGNYDYIWQYHENETSPVARGTLINRNHYALLMNICIAAGVGYLYYRSLRLLGGTQLTFRKVIAAPRTGKLGWLLMLLVVMGVALVFSMSRMGIAAMLLSVATMIVVGRAAGAGKRTAAIGLLLIVAILGMTMYAGLDAVIERYEKLSQLGGTEADRVAMWRDAWKLIKEHPLIGHGLGTFQWTYPVYESVNPDNRFGRAIC